MAIAMSAVVSRKIGAGLADDVRKVVTIGLLMVTIFSCFLAFVGYVFLDPIFDLIGAGDDVMPYIHDYMPIWFISGIFISIPIVANSAIRGMGGCLLACCGDGDRGRCERDIRSYIDFWSLGGTCDGYEGGGNCLFDCGYGGDMHGAIYNYIP